MKADLDQLMAARNLDALIVMGDSSGNPILQYLTGNIHLENALVVKRRGTPMTLIHGSMERDNAARTGMALVDRDQTYNLYELMQRHEGDGLAAQADYLGQIMEDFSLQGRVGFYGQIDMGAAHMLLGTLADRIPHVEIAGEYGENLFSAARETKDDDELADLAELGRRTCLVVDEVKNYLQSHSVRGEILMHADDEPLTTGHVRQFLRARLNAHDLHEDHQAIFAQGRESAVPHNAGSPDQILRLGQSIIFDIFPKGESGYFHDMTRTWSLGYATDPVLEAWEQTKELFDAVLADFRVGTPCRKYQADACDHYEQRGHKTIRTHPGTHEGYVHSLGHGIGLDIHEGPNLSLWAGNRTCLQPGHVITVEPGLYYPEQGFGVRIEDAVAFDAEGTLIWLTDYPYDLVVPMPKAQLSAISTDRDGAA